jgi:hypothetical protein
MFGYLFTGLLADGQKRVNESIEVLESQLP